MTRGPRTGAHLVPTDSLSQLDVPVAVGGVILGHARHREAVAIQLFRAFPTQVVMVTALWSCSAPPVLTVTLLPRPSKASPFIIRSAPVLLMMILPARLLLPPSSTGVRPPLHVMVLLLTVL